MNPRLRISSYGDRALSVALDGLSGAERVAAVRRYCQLLTAEKPPGFEEIVAGSTTITAHYDPLLLDVERARDALLTALAKGPEAPIGETPTEHLIPVRYDGPDLDYLVEQLCLTITEMVRLHTSRAYEVTLMGFVPGFGYLSSLPEALIVPRRATPRTKVPAGSVAIAGAQTAIYPAETPGGWHLIGRTSVPLFDPSRDPPNLLSVGDRVRFVVAR